MEQELSDIFRKTVLVLPHKSRLALTVLVVMNCLVLPLSAQNIFQRMDSVLTENYRKEYTSESLIVDIPAYTVLTLDTIVLKDVIPPQISAYRDSIRFSDDIYFFLYDDGSGINVNQLKVLVDFDTMQVNYQAPYLSFYTRCPNKCKIEISGEDYARNRLPNVYWFIENKYTYQYISGPFPNEEF